MTTETKEYRKGDFLLEKWSQGPKLVYHPRCGSKFINFIPHLELGEEHLVECPSCKQPLFRVQRMEEAQ